MKRYEFGYSCGDGFVAKESKNGDYVRFSDVEPLIEQNAAMRQMLKSLEFSQWDSRLDEWCCHMCCQHGTHAPDCKFAKLIGGDKDDDMR